MISRLVAVTRRMLIKIKKASEISAYCVRKKVRKTYIVRIKSTVITRLRSKNQLSKV